MILAAVAQRRGGAAFGILSSLVFRAFPISTILSASAMPKANYGIDAPTVLRNLSIAAAVGMIGGLVLLRYVGPIGRPFLSMGWGAGVGALLLLWSSLVGKFRARDALLNAVRGAAMSRCSTSAAGTA